MKPVNTHEILIPLENVESEHCAMIVDKGLNTIPEVQKHRVELNNHRAIIETDKPFEAIPEVVKKVRDLGYEVTTVKTTIPVLNMTCASCAISVESISKSVE